MYKVKKLTASLLIGLASFSPVGAQNVAQVLTGDGATEVNRYPSLQDAISAASAGQVVRLLDDVTATTRVNIGKGITLDLAGHTFTSTNEIGLYFSRTGATFKLTDSSQYKTGKISVNCADVNANVYVVYVRAGELVMDGGTIYTKSDNSIVTGIYVQNTNDQALLAEEDSYDPDAAATLTFKGDARVDVEGQQSRGIHVKGDLYAEGGHIESKSRVGDAYGIYGNETASSNIYVGNTAGTAGTTIKVTAAEGKTAYGLRFNGNATMTAGKVEVYGENADAVRCANDTRSNFRMTGGELCGTAANKIHGVHMDGYALIDGGTISVTSTGGEALGVFAIGTATETMLSFVHVTGTPETTQITATTQGVNKRAVAISTQDNAEVEGGLLEAYAPQGDAVGISSNDENSVNSEIHVGRENEATEISICAQGKNAYGMRFNGNLWAYTGTVTATASADGGGTAYGVRCANDPNSQCWLEGINITAEGPYAYGVYFNGEIHADAGEVKATATSGSAYGAWAARPDTQEDPYNSVMYLNGTVFRAEAIAAYTEIDEANDTEEEKAAKRKRNNQIKAYGMYLKGIAHGTAGKVYATALGGTAYAAWANNSTDSQGEVTGDVLFWAKGRNAYGISFDGQVDLQNGTIEAYATAGTAYGIHAAGHTHSLLTLEGTVDVLSDGNISYGVYWDGIVEAKGGHVRAYGSDKVYAAYVYDENSNLKLSGTEFLANGCTRADSTEVQVPTGSESYTYGLYCKSVSDMSGGKVIAKGLSYTRAVYLSIDDTDVIATALNATGGEIYAEGAGKRVYGIEINNNNNNNNIHFKLNGTSVCARGTADETHGVLARAGIVDIMSGILDISATNDTYGVTNNSAAARTTMTGGEIRATSSIRRAYGIYAKEGIVEVTDGTVSAESSGPEVGHAYGIYAYADDKVSSEVFVRGGYINAYSVNRGAYSAYARWNTTEKTNMTIEGGYFYAKTDWNGGQFGGVFTGEKVDANVVLTGGFFSDRVQATDAQFAGHGFNLLNTPIEQNGKTYNYAIMDLPVSYEGNTLVYGPGILTEAAYTLANSNVAKEGKVYAVDLSEVTGYEAPLTLDAVMNDMQDKTINALFYLPADVADSYKSMDNVVVYDATANGDEGGYVCQRLYLQDNDDQDNKTAFTTGGKAFTAVEAVYEREACPDFTCVVLPFDVVSDESGDAVFYDLVAVKENTTMNFRSVASLPAHSPAVLQNKLAEQGGKADFIYTANNVEVAPSPVANAEGQVSGWRTLGSYELVTLNRGTDFGNGGNSEYLYYFSTSNGKTNVMQRTGNRLNVKAFRGYFLTGANLVDDSSAAVRSVYFFDEAGNEIETGIGQVKAAIDRPATAAIYDLNGRRVQHPANKGVYIMNGKKVIF